jgi:hypothetical protein
MPEIKYLIIDCEKCGRNWIPIEQAYFSGYSQDCELCGSHSTVEVDFSCKCKNHSIKVYSD